ncbi:DUF1573 domain-containing protein [Botrimarina hoheduenensis]
MFSTGIGFRCIFIVSCVAVIASYRTTDEGTDSQVASKGNRSRDVHAGTVCNASYAEYIFEILNTGHQGFTITDVVKSCGCQDVGVEVGRYVKSGESLSVAYKIPIGSGGEQVGRLLIKTDSQHPRLGEIALTLRANFPRRIFSIPRELEFIKNKYGGYEPLSLVLSSDVPGVLSSLSRAEVSKGHVSVSQNMKTESAVGYEVSVVDLGSSGDAYDMVTFRFSDAITKVYGVRVKVRN